MQIILLVGVFLAFYIFQKLVGYRRAVRSIQNHPGYRTVLDVSSFLGSNFIPPIPGINIGPLSQWRFKHSHFAQYGWDIISAVSMWPSPKVTILLADAAAIKEVTISRARFPKPIEQYTVLTFFGHNIVASEGEEWKRYRKITAPAFSERNNRLVWDETVIIMEDLFNNIWGSKEQIVIDHAIEVTLPIALFVIGVAGFGRRISWTDDLVIPQGHSMSFKDSLHLISTDVFLRLAVPDWIPSWAVPQRVRNVRNAFDELQKYMMEMTKARRESEKKEERYDLFSSLLDASEDELDGQAKLTDRELMGNMFIFMLAGHETTAHTLCFTFAILALYENEQEILYQHIKSVLSDGRIPTYDDMNLLTQSLAVFYETLRMFPPVNGIPKGTAEDTSLVASNAAEEKITIPVPQGTNIIIHTPGLHYNPRYWADPYEFKPARFLGDWPRDAFLPFSGGARACLGRRFFETEGIAILTMLVLRYKIEVKEEPQFAAESFDQRKDRILTALRGLTLTPKRVPLVFKRR